MGVQVAAAVAIPLLLAAIIGTTVDGYLGTAPWGVLVSILVGLAIAGFGLFAILRRYLSENPVGAPTDGARAAGRRWKRDIEERERRREAGEEE